MQQKMGTIVLVKITLFVIFLHDCFNLFEIKIYFWRVVKFDVLGEFGYFCVVKTEWDAGGNYGMVVKSWGFLVIFI